MDFLGFLNNPWFIGIVGGVFSGLATTWIGRKVFSGKDKKEYLQKVDATNREIVYSLRSAISDNVSHNHDVIISLMSATARKNGVLLKDIYTIKEITEDLIKEVMDSSFIPSSYKKAFCEKLTELYLPSNTSTNVTHGNFNESKGKEISSTKREETVITTATGLLGVMVAMLTLIFTLVQSKNDILQSINLPLLKDISDIAGRFITIAFPGLIALVSIMVVFVIQVAIKRGKNHEIRTVKIVNITNRTSDGDESKENKDAS